MGRSSGRRSASSPARLDTLNTLFSTLVTSEDESLVFDVLPEFQRAADALQLLSALVTEGSSDERWWAVRLVAEIDQEGADKVLCATLSDPDPTVRQCAALCLREHPHLCAIPGLVSMLSADNRLEARIAGDALASQGSAAVPFLLDTLTTGSQVARVEAIRALALMDDLESVPALFAALDDESAIIGHWADEGLQRRGIGMVFY